MYLLNLLFNAIEPVSIVMVYDMFNNTKDKDTQKVMIRKNLVSFLILYGAIFVKQILLNNQSSPIIAVASCMIPIFLYYILPTFIYHIKNRYMINRALLTFFCLSLTTDCVILLSFGKSISTDSNSGWVLLFCSAGKLLQLVIARWLLQALQFRINEIAYIAICSILIILLSFITDFIFMEPFYKILALLIEIAFVFIIFFFLNKLLNLMKKHGTLRNLRHDEISHYALILDLAKNQKFKELESYEEQINSVVDSCRHCTIDNFVIASAVNYTLKKAQQYNIDFQYQLETSYIPLNLFEQNTVLRNILNNAVESCRACPNKPFIHLTISQNRYGETRIMCENSSLDSHMNYYITSKENDAHHGTGLLNIQSIVARKHGTIHCNYNRKKKVFLTSITLK